MKYTKTLAVAGIAVLACSAAFAQTVTVSASGGGNFTSIQAAIDSINATNGVPDIIEILDSATYEEQVVLGGLPPIDQASGTFTQDLMAQNRDPLTLRGPASGDRPTISPNSLVAYGVFENDPGDNFEATLVYFGKDITIENVAIQQIGGGPYGVNAQGVGITFRNCLFEMKPGTGASGEAAVNFNNSDIASDLFDDVTNDVLFDGCVFDAGEEENTSDTVYYHGVSDPGLDGTMNYTSNFVFNNCTFKDYDSNLTRLRARGVGEDDVSQTMTNCVFMDNTGDSLNLDGGGTKIVDGCLFVNNVNGEGTSPDSDNGALHIRGRSGRTGDVTIMNSIFSNNATFLAIDDPAAEQWAAIYVTNDGDDGPLVIDHCTFDTNSVAVRFADTAVRPRTATISNSIFSNNIAAGISADSLSGSYVGSGSEGELSLTITNCLFFNNTFDYDLGTVSGSVTGDPLYVDTETFALADGSPAIGAASDGSDIGAVQTGAASVEDYMLH